MSFWRTREFRYIGFLFLTISLAAFGFFTWQRGSGKDVLARVLPHIVVYCNILNLKGDILWSLRGNQCLFEENGGVIFSDGKTVQRLDHNFDILWSHSMPTHHQMNWSLNKEEILVMASEWAPGPGGLVKYDRFYVLNLEGQILKDFRTLENVDTIKARVPDSEKIPEFFEIEEEHRPTPDIQFEFTHSNSFYEIPDNQLAKKRPAFQKGNYILNFNGHGLVLVLDSNLKTILWSQSHFKMTGDRSIHDVQVIPNGKILYFNNRTISRKSALSVYDPILQKEEHLYQRNPPESFYAFCCGGVQLLPNGNLFFTDIINRSWIYEIDPDSPDNILWSMNYKNFISKHNQIILQAKRRNLESFLKKNSQAL